MDSVVPGVSVGPQRNSWSPSPLLVPQGEERKQLQLSFSLPQSMLFISRALFSSGETNKRNSCFVRDGPPAGPRQAPAQDADVGCDAGRVTAPHGGVASRGSGQDVCFGGV